MTPDQIYGLWITLVFSISCIALCPLVYWVLTPNRA